MQRNRIQLLFWLVSAVLLLNSCSDNSESPALKMTAGDKTFSLGDGKLYLVRETVTYTWNERMYVISDGDLGEGKSGMSYSDFTNSTYFLQLQFGVPSTANVSTGSYPQTPSWSVANPDSNVAYIHVYDMGTGEAYDSDGANDDDSPVIIEGAIDNGEVMTITFSGKLSKYAESGTIHGLNSTLFFKGAVIDLRDF